MLSQAIIKKIEDQLYDLRNSLRPNAILMNRVDDILDLVRKLKNRQDSSESKDLHSKFRKFQGLI